MQDKNRFDVNANKYFIIYKMGIETRNPKVVECCLYDIEVKLPINFFKKFISHNFLDGYSYDYAHSFTTEEQSPKNIEKKTNRMLIDSIVETVCSCRNELEVNFSKKII